MLQPTRNIDDSEKERLLRAVLKGETSPQQVFQEFGIDADQLVGWFEEASAELAKLGSKFESMAVNFAALMAATNGLVCTIPRGVPKGRKWRIYQNYPTLFASGEWDLEFQQALVALVRPGDVFFDIGANAGFHTLVGACLVGPSGAVVAFEPVPKNCELVREVIELNERSGNCKVVEAAVGAEEGTVTFFEYPANALSSLLPPQRQSRAIKQLKVKALTLDRYVVDSPAPSTIKIDVEGAEGLVVRGASGLLSQADAPALIIELHSPEAGAEVLQAFERHGYAYSWLSGEASELAKLAVNCVGHVIALSRQDARLPTVRSGIGTSWNWLNV